MTEKNIEITIQDRRLDTLARLLQGNSNNVSLLVHGNILFITANELFVKSKVINLIIFIFNNTITIKI